MSCPSCGMALPPAARFCARCGVRLDAAVPSGAPVWLLVLLWVGAGGLIWVAGVYAAFALGLLSTEALGQGPETGSMRGLAALVAVCAASLCAAHVAAAVGLMTAQPWARALTTMVCVVWALTCVGLLPGLLGIGALWRARTPSGPLSAAR